jgi:choline-glycine betaine transporter
MDIDTAKRFLKHRISQRTTEGSGPIHQARQAGTIISVVVVGVVALVGILIFAEIDSAIPDPSNPQLDNASTGITEGFGSAMDLVPIVLLVSVAALVIGVVQRLRSGGGAR